MPKSLPQSFVNIYTTICGCTSKILYDQSLVADFFSDLALTPQWRKTVSSLQSVSFRSEEPSFSESNEENLISLISSTTGLSNRLHNYNRSILLHNIFSNLCRVTWWYKIISNDIFLKMRMWAEWSQRTTNNVVSLFSDKVEKLHIPDEMQELTEFTINKI